MQCLTLKDLPAPAAGRTGWPWTEATQPLPPSMPNRRPWPKISIVTPSYNQGKYLEETIRSVLLQGYPDLEYIVMDGGSKDESIDIIRAYEPWLSYVHIGPDGGQSAAIAEGFRHATGQIIAWINSDDRYLPGAFARAAGFFATRPQIVFGSGDVNLVDDQSRFMQRIFAVQPNRMLTANLGLHIWPQPGCFWRRWAYQQSGGVDASLRFCMDRDLFLKLVGVGPGARIPGKPLADFRVHEEAKSSTILDVASAENKKLIERYGTPWLSSREWLLNLLWQLWTKPVSLRYRLHQAFGWNL